MDLRAVVKGFLSIPLVFVGAVMILGLPTWVVAAGPFAVIGYEKRRHRRGLR